MATFLIRYLVFALALSVAAPVMAAEQVGTEQDHEELRALMKVFSNGINRLDMSEAAPYLHQPFSGTAISQHFMATPQEIQSYFDDLFHGPKAVLKSVEIKPEVDELTEIYQGTFGVARGSNQETYELADGRVYEMTSRWTATVIKDEGKWKLLAIHAGINFLDNPVLADVESLSTIYGAGGAGGGIILGGLVGFLLGRRRRRA